MIGIITGIESFVHGLPDNDDLNSLDHYHAVRLGQARDTLRRSITDGHGAVNRLASTLRERITQGGFTVASKRRPRR